MTTLATVPASAATAPPGVPDVRRANLARVLGALRGLAPISRAGLAAATGLTKATVSAVVVDLAARGLVVEGEVSRVGSVGRPGRLLDLAGAPVRAVGVEVGTDHLTAVVLDVAGRVRWRRRVPVDLGASTADGAMGAVAELAGAALSQVRREGSSVLGLTISVPGLVAADARTVLASPNLPLSGVDVAAGLLARLAAGPEGPVPGPVRVDNDADLAAVAEQRACGVADLVYLTGEVGVGAGIVVGGRVLRGSGGFAGEIGHLPVPGATQRCGCGRIGCLEAVAGLAALLRAAAESSDPDRPGEDPLTALLRRADTDPSVRSALARAGAALGYGVSVLVNVLDPGRVVLGGAFAVLAAHLVPAAEAEMARLVVSPQRLNGPRLVASTVGPDAAALGAAAAVLDAVTADPSAVRRTSTSPTSASPTGTSPTRTSPTGTSPAPDAATTPVASDDDEGVTP